MTLLTSANNVVFRGNGATTAFAVPFKVLDEDHLQVRRRVFDTGAYDHTYVGTDFSYTGIGDSAGTLTLAGTALDDDYELVIERIVPYTQDLDIVNAGGFYPETVEEQLDLIVMGVQQVAELTDRAVTVPIGDTVPDYADFVSSLKGDPGGNSMAVGLFSALGTMTIPVGTDRIVTTGFSVAGKGAAFYKRVTAPAVNEQTDGTGYWLKQDADGDWWKLDERVPYSDMFGTKGDCVYDWLTGVLTSGTSAVVAIQKMIHFARYFGALTAIELWGPGECVISAGKHLIDDSIHLTYGTNAGGFSYGTLRIRGQGMSLRGAFNGGTTLACTSLTKPPFVVQGSVGVFVSDMSLLGPLLPWIWDNALAAPYAQDLTIDATNIVNWIDPAVLAAAPNINGRYSALAAVVVDGYCGVQQATHYPDIAYPAFLGAQVQYGKLYSSDVYMDRCYIGGFVAPMIISPSSNSAQGDFMGVRDCIIEACPYLFSAGNTQCRSIEFKNNQAAFFHTAIVNNKHGLQQGRMHGTFDNLSVYGGAIQIMDCSPAFAGPMTFTNLYAESIWRIGCWGTGAGGFGNPLVLRGGELNFTPADANPNGYPATLLSKLQNCHVTFDACAFNLLNEAMVLEGFASEYSFINGCRVGDGTASQYTGGAEVSLTQKCEYVATNFLAGVAFSVGLSASNIAVDFSTIAVRVNIDSGTADTGGHSRNDSSRTSRAYNACAWARYATPTLNPNLQLPMPPVWREDEKSAGDVARWNTISRVGRVVTATAPNSFTGSAAVRAFAGLLPGSIVWDNTGSYLFRILTVNAGVVTMKLLNGYKEAAGVITIVGDGYSRGVAPTGLSLTAGSYFLGNSAIFSPSYFTRADLDADTTIANVARGDGDGTHLTAQFVAGDCLFGDILVDNALNLTGNLIVTPTNGSPGSLVTSLAVTITQARYPLNFLIRGNIPNFV